MLWTAIGYSIDIKDDQMKETPFVKTFYGSHSGQMAIQDARKLFKSEHYKVIAVVAGDHRTSTYIKS
jgi:cephalosporin hydroxylase